MRLIAEDGACGKYSGACCALNCPMGIWNTVCVLRKLAPGARPQFVVVQQARFICN